MQKRLYKWLAWCVAGAFAFQGTSCTLDPDIALRAGILFASDLSTFLLENGAASL